MADDCFQNSSEIQRLHEGWNLRVRAELLEQFEREIDSWAQYRVSSRKDNDDLFANVRVTSSLDISSLPLTVNTTTASKPSRNKKKTESKTVKSIVRKCKKPRKRKFRSERLANDSDDQPQKVNKVFDAGVTESERGGNSRRSTPMKNDRPNSDEGVTRRHSSVQRTYQQTSVPSIHDQSSSSKRTVHENQPMSPSVKEEVQLSRGGSVNTQQLVIPVVQDGPSAAQVAMFIVQSLAWDTVRMVRRSGYSEGFSIVLVKPKDMPEAPTLLAMQNSKGDLTIPCDSMSNQRALFKIVGLLGE